ncbi:MAG: DUF2442 domain-containing protein [Bacteroidetes bacterium HGW-Bacteroidetes-13]|nr:MAG: DUF2442 domain-containing protein [Bacteroidetes bacterium HGW-Bacteroidetes-13]
MKILIDYKLNEINPITVERAKYIGDFAIRITFNDGTQKLVDFKSFLTTSQHPSIKKYLDEHLFINFKIVDGNLNWYDYDMIFPVENLYNGKIDV